MIRTTRAAAMKRLVSYLISVARIGVQLTFETIVGAIIFTLTIAIAAVILCFILKNAFE